MDYILNRLGEPVLEPDHVKFARWFHDADRHVADDMIGDVRVSTVFLGMDHNFSGHGPPVLWETMIFCPNESWHKEWSDYQVRYSSLADAKEGHKKAVACITHCLN